MVNISSLDYSNHLGDDGVTKIDYQAEDLRLVEQLKFIPSGNKMKYDVKTNELKMIWDKGRIWGFNVNTASFTKILSYFSTATGKKSQTMKSFILRKLAIRFPNEYTNNKSKLSILSKFPANEIELIESNATNDTTFTGSCGFNGKVRFDSPNKKISYIKSRNGSIRIKKN
jgi:hypothetical protein